MIEFKKLAKLFPALTKLDYKNLTDNYQRLGISDSNFLILLANVAIETGYFKSFEENLKYTTVKRLKEIFPKYFKDQDPTLFVNNPAKLANLVYGGRMGNKLPNDGFKFRGRGMIQLTGRASYDSLSRKYKELKDIVEQPDLVSKDSRIKALSCLYFWIDNGLHQMDDFVAIRKKVNGGTHGLEECKAIYKKLLAL